MRQRPACPAAFRRAARSMVPLCLARTRQRFMRFHALISQVRTRSTASPFGYGYLIFHSQGGSSTLIKSSNEELRLRLRVMTFLSMPISPKLGPEAAAANMSEIAPRYTPQEAAIEANRCLFCFDAPCIQACPTGIDIPSFIKKIITGNLTGSARTILSANILGASCGRVCPTEVLCEGACVVLDREGDPVKIGRLQRYATDHVIENHIQLFRAPAKKSGKRVAIIGGG